MPPVVGHRTAGHVLGRSPYHPMAHLFGYEIGSAAQHPASVRMGGEALER